MEGFRKAQPLDTSVTFKINTQRKVAIGGSMIHLVSRSSVKKLDESLNRLRQVEKLVTEMRGGSGQLGLRHFGDMQGF